MEESFKKFIKDVKRVSSTRETSSSRSFGVYDSYKWIRKNKWFDIGRPLKEHEFYSIIRAVNTIIASNIAKGEDFTLPCRLGRIELRKYNPRISIVDNKIVYPIPIDWDRTLKLWYEDKEAKNKKTLIRVEDKNIYKLYYNKNRADYTNKSFFILLFNRELKNELKKNIRGGVIVDAFNRYGYVE
jgi:hypothetical protein